MSSPFFIGVSGGTGSGKTTAVTALKNSVDPQHLRVIMHDDYYKDQTQLPIEERMKTNYDHPLSLETELLVRHLQDLKDGKPIQQPVYDFVQCTRLSETVTIQPTKIILIEGILIFESKALRDLLDLRIFVDTDADIRFIRRLQRDIKERGRTVESVIEQYQTTVKPMHDEFVEPNKKYADIIIPEGKNMAALDLVIARVKELTRE